jgi:tetratricopeptide (TPR) repeat protein
MISFSNPFTPKGISQLLQRADERYPKVYLGIAVVVTALGYFALALVPILLLTAVLKLLFGVASADTFAAWLGLLIWLVIGIATGTILAAMLLVKTHMPAGLGLKDDKAPRLYELLDEISARYNSPSIDRIIVHDQCSLDLVPVPRFGLPLLKVNVLYIGLPVLQCLSPTQFRGLMARRLGQYAASTNKLTHWIYRFRQYCQQYQRFYRKQKNAIYLPLKWFFKIYTPILNTVTVHAARRDELVADAYVLDIMNDEELADMIIRYEVSNHFLKTKYWPKIIAMLRKNQGDPQHTPHVNMAKVMRSALTENESAQIIKELMNSETSRQEIKPDLHTRLENIGQRRLNMPPPVMETAAQRYLGNAFSAVLKLLDKQWLARYSASSRSKKNTAVKALDEQVTTSITADTQAEDSDSARLEELKKKAGEGNLSSHEAITMARLTEKLEGKAAAIALYQRILKQDPNNAETLFDVGRILLTQKDKSGIKILEKAMQLNKGCVAQACWMLANYFKSVGDEQQSKHYLKRAASVGDAA